MGSRIDVYLVSKHPDSKIDYGRNWGDISHTEEQVLTTETTHPNGSTTTIETIETVTIVDKEGWLQEGEVIIESTWKITADREDPPTLVESSEGTGIAHHGKITGIYLEGGTPGIQYTLANTILAVHGVNGTTRTEVKSGVINCCIR